MKLNSRRQSDPRKPLIGDAESLEAKRRVARKFMEYNRKKPVKPKTFVPMDRMA